MGLFSKIKKLAKSKEVATAFKIANKAAKVAAVVIPAVAVAKEAVKETKAVVKGAR